MPDKIGARIRTLRKKKGISLNQLAQEANIAPSFLSELERGKVNLSVKSLRAIATALNVPAFQLIQEDENGTIVRKDHRAIIQLPNSGQVYELLSPNTSTPLRLIRIILEPGFSTDEDSVRHTGHEVATVLHGQVTVVLEGQEHHLAEGDSIFFDSNLAHAFRNPGPDKTELIIANSLTRFL